MLFGFESFCNKVKKCSDEIFRYIVYGNWYGNTWIVIGLFFFLFYESFFFIRYFVIWIIFYFILLFGVTFYLGTRRVGFGVNKNKFIYVKFSHLFYKVKKVWVVPFDKITYLNIHKVFGLKIVNMSFLSDKGKIEKIKFTYNNIVIGLSVTEQRKNAMEVSKKLLEKERELDRGDF